MTSGRMSPSLAFPPAPPSSMSRGSDLGEGTVRRHHLPQLCVVLLYPLCALSQVVASLSVALLLDLLLETPHRLVELLGAQVHGLDVLLELVVLLLLVVQRDSERCGLLGLLAQQLVRRRVRRTSGCSSGARCLSGCPAGPASVLALAVSPAAFRALRCSKAVLGASSRRCLRLQVSESLQGPWCPARLLG